MPGLPIDRNHASVLKGIHSTRHTALIIAVRRPGERTVRDLRHTAYDLQGIEVEVA